MAVVEGDLFAATVRSDCEEEEEEVICLLNCYKINHIYNAINS